MNKRKDKLMLNKTKTFLNQVYEIPEKILQLSEASEKTTEAIRRKFRQVVEYNQLKVLSAFKKYRLSESHFAGTTGYGFNDSGRETLDKICAEIFGAEKGLIRWQFVSGTHALSSVLFGNLRPGDRWLSITGKPYDTLHPVIDGQGRWEGSLKEWGIEYEEVPLTEDSKLDYDGIRRALQKKPRLIYIQRSLGYCFRPSIGLDEMERVTEFVKSYDPSIIVMVDNCYGEFVEAREPLQIGADVIGGSLIKNPGGGIAPAGAYIAGKSEIVHRASIHLTSPGIGPDEGATMAVNRLIFQGLFLAPSIVGQAIEGAIWASHLVSQLGLIPLPTWNARRTDLIQGILLGGEAHLKSFCRGIQKSSPVDSFATPEAVYMPGYRDPIIMAGGTFIQGSSIELSADGPLREPFAVYLQGGLSYSHVKIGVLNALSELVKDGLMNI